MYLTKYLSILLLLIVFACNKPKENQKHIRIEIQNVELNYVWVKRDWCRMSNIYLIGKIFNETDSLVKINFNKLSSFCDFDQKGNFELDLNNKKYNGIAINEKESKKIEVGDSLIFKFRIQRDIIDEDDLYFNSANWIKKSQKKIGIYINKSDTFEILKSNNIKYKFLLDDINLNTNDSLVNLYKKNRAKLYKYYEEKALEDFNQD